MRILRCEADPRLSSQNAPQLTHLVLRARLVPHGALQCALRLFEGTLASRGFLPNASTPVLARAAGPDEFGQRTPLPIDRQLKTHESIRQLHPHIVAREAPADMPSLQAIRRTYVVTALHCSRFDQLTAVLQRPLEFADRGLGAWLQGVTMHRPNEAGYSHSDAYVI